MPHVAGGFDLILAANINTCSARAFLNDNFGDGRASPVFLTYTLLMNAIPGAIAVAVAAVHWRNDCAKNLLLWLLVYALIFGLFMIGAQLVLLLCTESTSCSLGVVATYTWSCTEPRLPGAAAGPCS